MSVTIHIIQGPLRPLPEAWALPHGLGACLTFEGIVRPTEDGRPITALDYEAYEPMASRMLRQIGEQLIASHDLLGICVEHSVGVVNVSDVSFRLRIASEQRKQALAAADAFIDQMKKDVPLWKRAVYNG